MRAFALTLFFLSWPAHATTCSLFAASLIEPERFKLFEESMRELNCFLGDKCITWDGSVEVFDEKDFWYQKFIKVEKPADEPLGIDSPFAAPLEQFPLIPKTYYPSTLKADKVIFIHELMHFVTARYWSLHHGGKLAVINAKIMNERAVLRKYDISFVAVQELISDLVPSMMFRNHKVIAESLNELFPEASATTALRNFENNFEIEGFGAFLDSIESKFILSWAPHSNTGVARRQIWQLAQPYFGGREAEFVQLVLDSAIEAVWEDGKKEDPSSASESYFFDVERLNRLIVETLKKNIANPSAIAARRTTWLAAKAANIASFLPRDFRDWIFRTIEGAEYDLQTHPSTSISIYLTAAPAVYGRHTRALRPADQAILKHMLPSFDEQEIAGWIAYSQSLDRRNNAASGSIAIRGIENKAGALVGLLQLRRHYATGTGELALAFASKDDEAALLHELIKDLPTLAFDTMRLSEVSYRVASSQLHRAEAIKRGGFVETRSGRFTLRRSWKQ